MTRPGMSSLARYGLAFASVASVLLLEFLLPRPVSGSLSKSSVDSQGHGPSSGPIRISEERGSVLMLELAESTAFSAANQSISGEPHGRPLASQCW
jgi:hypothetical protein